MGSTVRALKILGLIFTTSMEWSILCLFSNYFLLPLALAYILSAERSKKKTKNASFHACSRNEP